MQVHKLHAQVREGLRQLQQAREQGTEGQLRATEAEGRVARAEALLQKTAERKAAAEVERKRMQEAAGRLEQQVLELHSRLEASGARERAAQAEAERLRAASSKREGDARQLAGAMSQLEIAEAALRDSQATASRLLQDCTALRRDNEALAGQLRGLEGQLAEAQGGEAATRTQLADLQEVLDATITELELARALLSRRRQQESEENELERLRAEQQQQQAAGPFSQQRIVAFPMRAELTFDPVRVSCVLRLCCVDRLCSVPPDRLCCVDRLAALLSLYCTQGSSDCEVLAWLFTQQLGCAECCAGCRPWIFAGQRQRIPAGSTGPDHEPHPGPSRCQRCQGQHLPPARQAAAAPQPSSVQRAGPTVAAHAARVHADAWHTLGGAQPPHATGWAHG